MQDANAFDLDWEDFKAGFGQPKGNHHFPFKIGHSNCVFRQLLAGPEQNEFADVVKTCRRALAAKWNSAGSAICQGKRSFLSFLPDCIMSCT